MARAREGKKQLHQPADEPPDVYGALPLKALFRVPDCSLTLPKSRFPPALRQEASRTGPIQQSEPVKDRDSEARARGGKKKKENPVGAGERAPEKTNGA